MDNPGLIVLFLVICIAVTVLTTILQYKLRQKRGKPTATNPQENPSFVVGRIYQMEDGSLAKYIGDNKFLKVKMK